MLVGRSFSLCRNYLKGELKHLSRTCRSLRTAVRQTNHFRRRRNLRQRLHDRGLPEKWPRLTHRHRGLGLLVRSYRIEVFLKKCRTCRSAPRVRGPRWRCVRHNAITHACVITVQSPTYPAPVPRRFGCHPPQQTESRRHNQHLHLPGTGL